MMLQYGNLLRKGEVSTGTGSAPYNPVWGHLAQLPKS